MLIQVHRIELEVNTAHITPVPPESFRNEMHCGHGLLSLEFHFLLAVFGSPLPDKRFDGRKWLYRFSVISFPYKALSNCIKCFLKFDIFHKSLRLIFRSRRVKPRTFYLPLCVFCPSC